MPVSKPLDRVLEVYCHVNAINIELLAEHCKKEDWSYASPMEYKDQLRDAISKHSISVAEYDRITQEEFDSEEELYAWLTEVWDKTIGEPL
ncbi:hypothetical protein L2750_16350 [Shewanella submarina]|uniref:Uncharacterized protein n=1 Tax=Shewanella submarina TaxID=2016376 RepID=A0ABV7GHG5_9GAMM|nr:hypothetical protein [Shewanella submarina]MCL1038701.1 hypothetical protein [Shewanella submarina]